MIDVRTDLEAYRTAVAELPERTRLQSGRAAGHGVAVVSGAAGWAVGAARAIDAGARAIIVDAPALDGGDLTALHRSAVPVLLARRGLRADDAGDAAPAAPPSAVTVQVSAPRGALASSLVDAAGWARVLSGGTLTVVVSRIVGGAALADLRHPAASASLIGTERIDPRGGARMRATALAPERIEVVSDGVSTTVTHVSTAGELTMPRRWESPARLALRRAIAAVEEGSADTDLDDWVADVDAVNRILGRPSGHQ